MFEAKWVRINGGRVERVRRIVWEMKKKAEILELQLLIFTIIYQNLYDSYSPFQVTSLSVIHCVPLLILVRIHRMTFLF
jgi:hypothetical protein